MNLELTPEQVQVLRKLIEREIQQINPEIHHTGTAAMRDELKEYREALRAINARLGPDEEGTGN
jgi:Spy/CpxP family protein refolding chaperone